MSKLDITEGRRLLEQLRQLQPFASVGLANWLWTHREELVRCAEESWSVRVLDRWGHAQSPIGSTPAVAKARFNAGYVVSYAARVLGEGDTKTAARLAAARAVWPDLPEDVRRELGECPT